MEILPAKCFPIPFCWHPIPNPPGPRRSSRRTSLSPLPSNKAGNPRNAFGQDECLEPQPTNQTRSTGAFWRHGPPRGCLQKASLLYNFARVLNLPFRAGTLNQYSITYDVQFLIKVSQLDGWTALCTLRSHYQGVVFGSLKDMSLIIY